MLAMGIGRDLVTRWTEALSDHDLEAAVSCFHPDYRDEAPARTGEVVAGREQVRRNFARLLGDVPDLRAEILSLVEDGESVWLEWRMRGTRPDGSNMTFVGVNIFGVADDLLARGRIYTELVRDAGGADAQVDRMTRAEAEGPGT